MQFVPRVDSDLILSTPDEPQMTLNDDNNGYFFGIFNKTARSYLTISALLTTILMFIVIAIGPQRFHWDKIHFRLCEPDSCSQHRTIYIFAFGLMCTWFVSGMIFFIFKTSKNTISRYILPAQIILQIIFTLLGAFMEERVYKIGYWMFFNAIKYYFLQSVLLIQTIQSIHSILYHHDRHRIILILNLFTFGVYSGFAAMNALWFFGPQCNNSFDIMYVCVMTVNILAFLSAIFDHSYGFFLPLCLAAVSQITLFHTLHSTPKALTCGSSPMGKFNGLEWICLVIGLIGCIIPSIKILSYFTSQRSINDLYFNQNLRHYSFPLSSPLGGRHDALLFDTSPRVSNSNIRSSINNNNNDPYASTRTDSDVNMFGTYASSLQSSGGSTYGAYKPKKMSSSSPYETPHQLTLINTPTLAPRHYHCQHASTLAIDDIEQDVFVEHYYYSPTSRCSNGTRIYFFATFIFSIFVFTLTHFGEHKDYLHVGINSNHIQWFYVMNMGWSHLLYFWYILAIHCCPKKNLV